MKKLARIVSAGVSAAVIGVIGLSTAASATSIYNTGNKSNNGIHYMQWNFTTKVNTNAVGVNNNNYQMAHSGNAYAKGNLFSGGATTGPAMNWNNTSTNLYIWNH